MGPIMARFAPRVMVAQASAARRERHGEPVPARRRHARRAAPGRSGPRPAPHHGGQPAPPPHQEPAARVRQHHPARRHRRARRVRWRTVRPGRLAHDDVDAAIARHALAYVHDGSTLQTGIGAIPNIVAAELARGPLGGFGVHSEMFTTGLMRLHQAGKVTNDAKGVFDGVSVTTFALGVAELYRWLDGNEEVAFLPVETVNDPTVIARNANLVSINGALSVDLYGQVMADSIDGRQISGVGGHEDFVAGAELHLDAHSLICLRSTAERDGEIVSRIAGMPPHGTVVSTPRHHTGVVITEYGAAELTGRTVRERAHLLVDIAHPDFRPDLRRAADGLGRADVQRPGGRGRRRGRATERRRCREDAGDEVVHVAEHLAAVVRPRHQDLEDVEHAVELAAHRWGHRRRAGGRRSGGWRRGTSRRHPR